MRARTLNGIPKVVARGKRMPRILYLPDGKEVETDASRTILETALGAGIMHDHTCGGHGQCSTCRVAVIEGIENCSPRTPLEEAVAKKLHFDPSLRLACQTRITGDVKLRRLVVDAEDAELADATPAAVDRSANAATTTAVGRLRHWPIMFADIRGFTAFAESLMPYDVVHVLNKYFNAVGEPIARRGGYVSDYEGDGLMALFPADDLRDGALRAVEAGLEMLRAVEGLGKYLDRLFGKSFRIGIGLHCGQVVVGEIALGDTKRMAAVGDAVNLANRIEQANKEIGTNLLVSEETLALVEDRVLVGRSASVELHGKSSRYTVHEVVGLAGADAPS